MMIERERRTDLAGSLNGLFQAKRSWKIDGYMI